MIERLEKLGFKVIVVTGDAVAPSHTFFHMHGKTEGDVCYKTKSSSLMRRERCVFFMSDALHLIKMTRSHSYGHGNHRKLWVRSVTCIRSYMCYV